MGKFLVYYSDFAANSDLSWADDNGSENYHLRLVKSLRERGHEVASWVPGQIGEVVPAGWEGFTWLASRDPRPVQNMAKGAEKMFLLCHDLDYPGLRTDMWDGLLVESEIHARYLRGRYPSASVVVVGNGVELEKYRLADSPDRDPRRVVYTSCPSRGLWELLRIWPRVWELVPDAKLDIYYGWGTMDRLIARGGQSAVHLARKKEACLKRIDQLSPSVTFHGRVPKVDLIRALHSASVWAYPVGNFPEVCCVSSIEAQLCGLWPVVHGSWAVGETTRNGWAIHGDLEHPTVRATWAYDLAGFLQDGAITEETRQAVRQQAVNDFNWEAVVDRIEAAANGA